VRRANAEKNKDMKLLFPFRIVTAGLALLILISVVTAVAATNTVSSTKVTNQGFPIGVNNLKPSACAGIVLSALITGSVTINGTNGNDLILGRSGIDTVNGLDGNDCILGGGGADIINGGNGNDVCIGGPGVDEFLSCETQIQ
jgi:Ca2+-binding RTX toxin-like protein